MYLLIAISQIILRRRSGSENLKVKMWLFPGLSFLTVAGIVAVLVQMAVDPEVRPQLILSLLAWAAVIVFFFITKWRGGSVDAAAPATPRASNQQAQRVLVLANETVVADELLHELRAIDDKGKAQYFVCVPANPVDTGQAEYKGAVYLWDATRAAAQERLDYTLSAMRADGLTAEGDLGDYRPLRALADAVAAFSPDQIVISTLPPESSVWLRDNVVDRARTLYDMPVTHVVSKRPQTASL